MGSTGRGIYVGHNTKGLDNDTFGIAKAVPFKGKVPEGKGIEQPSANKITLKVPAEKKSSILFQFKLSRDSKTMTISAYHNGIPEVKCKVAVDSGKPSIDRLMATTTDKAVKVQATKMKNLFAKSTTIKENQLGAIANKLLEKKRNKEGVK